MDFLNKTVLLTGASSGIGYKLAKLIGQQKCNLVLLSRRKEITDSLAQSLNSYPSSILSLKCDVTKNDEVQSAINLVKKEYGKIDIAILNSGVSYRSTIDNFSIDEAHATFNVNVFGQINFVHALLPEFKNNKSGMFVGVSSLADGRGFPRSGFYCASKAASTILLESWRVEMKKYNIKVLTVKPGFVRTPMTAKNEFAMPFLMDDEKAARIIFNGIKKEKRVIQFPLPTVIGAKLLRIMPDFIFDILAEKS